MLRLLKQLNYQEPFISEYQNGKIDVYFDEEWQAYKLTVGGKEWMSYDIKGHTQAFEFYSHYNLAKGHCICTGMGFGVRESWLLRNPDVTKVTVIEKNPEVIEYHEYNKSPFLKHVEVINDDASTYKGSCDTLLLDHYESSDPHEVLADASRIVQNIEHDTLWIWPLEAIVTSARRRRLDRSNVKVFSDETFITRMEVYENLKQIYELDTLPELSEGDLDLFCFMYHSKLYSDYKRLFLINHPILYRI